MTYEECAHVTYDTLLTSDRSRSVFASAQEALSLDGAFYECGVYKGGIAHLLAEVIARSGVSRSLHLFDSFEGLPDSDPSIDGHKKGEFSGATEQALRDRLAPYCDAYIHTGWIPATFGGRERDKIAFAHLDLDLYLSTKVALDFVMRRLVPGGIVILDDYGSSNCRGVEKAVNEVLRGRSEQCEVSAYEQGRIIRGRGPWIG